MADTPVPRSPEQILGDMIDAYRSKQGVKNMRVGGPLLSMFEAATRSDARSSQDIFQLLNSIALDNSTGLALDRAGADEKLPRFQRAPASGTVTITDTSFTKITSKLYQGSPAPIVGSATVDVVDATLFPSSGSVYIGRGTPNYEGPIAYSSKVNNSTHWTLNLVSGTTRFHNTSEVAVVAQGGNRTVGAGVVVRTPQANVANAVEFRLLYARTIPDGEVSLAGIQVVAQKPGTIGNVGKGDIREFSGTPPFTGASVTNPTAYSNGREVEKDDDYRERIKARKASKQLGTELALITFVTGITASDENKRVSSASFVRRLGQNSTLYIDDGTGYEEVTTGVPTEVVVDEALGGEQYFDLVHRPVARAFVKTGNASPYALSAGANLTVKVGGESFTHNFDPASFSSISSASAFEVAASINANPALGFLARTSDAGTEVAIFSKADTNEFIEVVASDGTDANEALGFPTGVAYTLQLYKNDRLLVKDGQAAAYAGLPFSQWNAMAGSQDLVVSVDGTPAIDYTFVDQDFVDGLTGFSVLGKNTAAAWATVINNKIPGVTATVDGGHLVLTSNVGLTGRAQVSVTGGSLVGAHLFAVGSARGADRDYTLDRNRGEVALEEPLAAGDRLTIGSIATRAFVESGEIAPVTTSNVAKMWFVVDGDAQVVATGVNGATSLALTTAALHEWGHTLQIAAASGTPFTNVRAGDWLVLWDPALDASMLGSHRVVTAQGNALTVERRLGTAVRSGHRTVALQTSGSALCKVLTTGGTVFPLNPFVLGTMPLGATSTCSIFDPNTNLSAPCAPMIVPRVYHTATLLANGKVLVTGGVDDTGHPVSSIEIYDPAGDSWTASGVSLTTAVFQHQATLLANGKVLVTGGDNGTGAINAFQVYDPNTDTIAPAGTMAAARAKHKAVLMPVQSDVLIVGGYNGARTTVATAEIWNHTTLLSSATGSMTKPRQGHGLACVGTTPTTVLVAGNGRGVAGNTTREIYTIGAGTWGAETALPSNCTFEEKDLVTLSNGHVVGLHGFDSGVNTTGRGFTYDGAVFTAIAADPKQTDSSTKFEGQYVEIKDGISSVKNRVCAVGGGVELTVSYHIQPTAQIEIYNETSPGWTIPDPAAGTTPTVSQAGFVVVRTDGVVREVDVPVGTNYTANTIAGAINDDVDNPGLFGTTLLGGGLTGATAEVYKTNRIRVVTNTFNETGDIALVTQNVDAQGFELTPGSAIDNLAGHVGSILSRSELGTPSFSDTRVLATSKGTVEKVVLGTKTGDLGCALVGLRNWWRGADGTSTWDGASYYYARSGANFNTRTRLTDLVVNANLSRFGLRAAAERPWTPQDRAYLAAPFAIGPSDDLTVVVDNDPAKRFAVKMYRDLATVGNTYSATNTFKDKTAGGSSLVATFGSEFDFSDFAAYMPARAVGYPADNTRSMLFRFYRLGPDGNGVRVRFGNPLAPNAPVSVGIKSDTNDGTEEVTVRISSGAPRTLPNIHTTTTLMGTFASVSGGGVGTYTWVANLKVASATRAANVDTLTLTLPPGVTDHGILVADQVWINSSDVNFSSGLKTITARTATTISYAETAANAGPDANIGTASRDTAGEASFSGGGVAVGDFFQVPSGTGIFRISVVDGTGGYLQVTSGDQEDDTGLPPDGHLDILGPFIQIFQGSSQTATQLVAAINALAAAANSTCPLTAFVLGTGAGLIDRSTVDNDNAQTWYTLADGVNWVLSSAVVVGDYQLTFKKPITGSLATSADWQHETVRLCPTTTKNVVDWLNAPTVSGLFTACYVQSADDGRRVQIASQTIGTEGSVQVQGGLANNATAAIVGMQSDDGFATTSTIRTTDAAGLVGGAWCRIQNAVTMPIASALGVGVGLLSWNAAGLVRFNSPVVSINLGPSQQKLQFEKQGDFVAVSCMGIDADPVFSTMAAGSYVRITPAGSPTGGFPQVSTANQGIFRVLRIDHADQGSSGTVWIENPNAIEERSECTLTGLDRFTALPGDKFVIASPIFGVDNQGTWTIKAVGETSAGSGDQFTQTDRFTVDVSTRAPVPQGVTATMDLAASRLVKLVESVPAVFVMQVKNVLPNQLDGSFTDVRWDATASYSAIDAAAGSVATVMDKLSFPLDASSGTDGYNYDVGLIGEANRVVYGDPSDTSTYPGVAAEGSDVDIQGPLVKRLQFSLLLRTKSSGISNNDVADRVRSAVATAVNQSDIGQPIALSAVVAAAQKVVGVVSVTILSPTYNAGNDLIPVQTFEKALVLNLDQDVQVTFAGT